jgi:NADP-dependent 3-hydroxy acid dehydrogenase YdfG
MRKRGNSRLALLLRWIGHRDVTRHWADNAPSVFMTHAHSVTTGRPRRSSGLRPRPAERAVDTLIQTKRGAEKDRKKQKMEMLEPQDIAEAIVFVFVLALAQPKRCDIVTVQVRPLKQLI